jgi:hypothetical protein
MGINQATEGAIAQVYLFLHTCMITVIEKLSAEM